jgi:hypothetical protein
MPMIADRVELARRGANDTVICRLPCCSAVATPPRSSGTRNKAGRSG